MTPQQIISLRKRLKISQGGLALKVGVWRETVSTWESGGHKPSFNAINKLRSLAGLRNIEREEWVKIGGYSRNA